MSIKTVVVDDERKARETLIYLLNEYCKEIDIVATFDNILDAEQYIINANIDLLFLDVEMPEGTGLHLMKKIASQNIKVIMITAHDHYAIKAIKQNVFDYILKPIDVSELQDAIEKFKQQQPPITVNEQTDNPLSIPTNEGVIFIKQSTIIRIKAEGSYSNIYTDNGKVLVSKNLTEITEQLNPQIFFRVHHSHIANLTKVKSYLKVDGNIAVMEDDSKVDISRRKKADFLKKISLLN